MNELDRIADIAVRYYGVDWVMLVLLPLGQWMITKEKRYGFIVLGLGSLAALVLAILTAAIGSVIMNILFGFFSFKAFFVSGEWLSKSKKLT